MNKDVCMYGGAGMGEGEFFKKCFCDKISNSYSPHFCENRLLAF